MSGRLDDPQIEGIVRAGRLRYAGFDFKGGELSVNYRGGTAAVAGWVAAPENRLRVVVEPALDWRFEADLELRRFAPELVRSGLGAFPPGVGQALGRAAFLATGRLQGAGRLFDPGSVRADVGLDTLWLRPRGPRCRAPHPCGSPGATPGSWWRISGWPASSTTCRFAGAGASRGDGTCRPRAR